MYNIRLADGAFVFSFRDVDKYVIKGDFTEGYVVYDAEETPLYTSISFEACVVWVINS